MNKKDTIGTINVPNNEEAHIALSDGNPSILDDLGKTLKVPTVDEYFKDVEKTGKFPEKIEELLKEGKWRDIDILDYLERDLGIDIVSSRDELLGFLPEDKQLQLWALARNHFGTCNMLVNYSGEGSQECSDGSDLLTLVKLNGKICLVKLACGEFNRKTFIDGVTRFPELKLHKSEIPLFVVNQEDSYFAGKGTSQADIRNIDPRLYLSLYSVIFSPKGGEATKRYIYDESESIDWSKVKILNYDELVHLLE